MNTKKRLNCYVFSNLMISILALNIMTNPGTTELIKKTSVNTLNRIYKDEIVVETVEVPDTIVSNISNPVSNVVSVSNKVLESGNTCYRDYVKPSYNSLTGTNLVNYARNFLGLRYVSAGNSLQTGTDCSGFTRLIYGEFGISLGRTVGSQIYSGTYVSKNDLEPGDLVFYSYGSVASHVAIYMGDGLIIHESNPRDGVKISSVNIMNYITARRLITSNVTSSVGNTLSEVKDEVKQEVVVETPKQEIVNTPEPEVKETNENEFLDISNQEEIREEVVEIKEEETVKEEKPQEENVNNDVIELEENKNSDTSNSDLVENAENTNE